MTAMQRKDQLVRAEFGHPQAFEIKELSDTGEFDGYGSVFNVTDQGGDVLVPGAFAVSLSQNPSPKMLWQHNPSEPIGKWLELREDDKGLYCRGKLNLKIGKAGECHAMMLDKMVDGLSIGYRTVKDEIDRATGVRRLMQVDLMEISVVTFPMNRVATINRVKGETIPTERELEQVLRDVGLSTKQAKAFIARGYKAAFSERDAGMDEAAGVKDALARLSAMLRS